ncbi:5-(carboxyamino)imidazole ribonucleotide synthase [Georgenia sp. MJ173]|uniref:5-(carboxyamino)imidazole ribonucleotide synthase n=1 Tax=Georgenia sunbinii TaxID=3117728 RepID=UPI002F260BAA
MGAHVAVVGGGQLARMMQQAAIGLDVHLRVLVEAADGSAAQVVPDAPVGAASDESAVRGLLAGVDVLTFEHEHVPGSLLTALEAEGVAVRPGSGALRHAQDKIVMREALSTLEVPCPQWAAVRDTDELTTFGDRAGWPVVIKTARGGYDGKGVRVVHDAVEAKDWLDALDPDVALLAEEHVPFTRELAVLVARRPGGEVRAWPVTQTVQEGGVCAEAIAPAPGLDPVLEEHALDIARRIAEGLDVTGVLAVEMFELPPPTEGGMPRVVVNELAMRPHNSGHWTIDGAATSQFEQHLRAVLDLPLGPTTPLAPVSVMANLLGSALADPASVLPELLQRCPNARVHLYGKAVRPGRKLGHVTVVGEELAAAQAEADLAVALLRGEKR